MTATATLALTGLLLFAPASAAGGAYPQPVHPLVNDFAGLLAPRERETIVRLAVRIAAGGTEVVVVTVPSIGEYRTGAEDLRAFAAGLLDAWSIGDPTRDDGIVVLVSPGDGKLRIHAGEGHDGMLDEAMRRVLFTRMRPHLDREDWEEALFTGLIGISEALFGEIPAALPMAPPRPRPRRALTSTVTPALVLGGALALLIASLGRVRTDFRRRFPGRCARCAAPVRHVPSPDDEVLGLGRRTEQVLESVAYEVWRCTGCGEHRIEARAARHSRYRPCPSCGHRTLAATFRPLVAATDTQPGLDLRILECVVPGCDHREETSELSYPRRPIAWTPPAAS